MDFGDIVRLIIFGVIFLSFFSGLFERGKKDEKKPAKKPAAAPRPRELSQSGGQERTRPLVTVPAPEARGSATREPVDVEVFTGEGTSRTEARRGELRERFGGRLGELEAAARERRQLESDLTDMPSPMDTDPERRRRPRRTQVAATRRHHPATGGDVLRRSLKDPDTLERAFIIKEVLDRPLGLRGDR